MALGKVHIVKTALSEQSSGGWSWLVPVQEELARLGLNSAVFDAGGRAVTAAPSAGPLALLLEQLCATRGGQGRAVRQFLARPEGQAEGARMPCVLPGCFCLLTPVRQRRRTVGAVCVCMISRDCADSEELARLCQRCRLDREVTLRLIRQAGRFDSDQAEVVHQMVRLIIEQASEKHLAGGELGKLSENLTSTYEELSLLYKISVGMKVTEKPADYLRNVGIDLLEVLGVESLAWRYFRPDQPLVSEHIAVGDDLTPPEVEQTMWDELLALFESGQEQLVDNGAAGGPAPPNATRTSGGPAEGRSGGLLHSLSGQRRVRRAAAVPMVRNGKLFGALLAQNKRAKDFDMIDVKLMRSITNEASVFLENAFLYEDLQQLLMGVLRALVSSIDAKDPYTCGHSERVGLIASRIAASIGLDDAIVGRVHLAGLLHDIGKIGVPEAVLTKPGRLTSAEFVVMRRHPEIGANILAGIKQVQDLLPGVLSHHERMDGKGYPQGLAGERIPLFGRIIGLADCFDAMTSDRTYRRAPPLEVTLAEIRRCAGTQFDPRIVEAFLRLDAAELARHEHPPSRFLETKDPAPPTAPREPVGGTVGGAAPIETLNDWGLRARPPAGDLPPARQ